MVDGSLAGQKWKEKKMDDNPSGLTKTNQSKDLDIAFSLSVKSPKPNLKLLLPH